MIVLGLLSVLGVSAQMFDQLPEVTMRSTSTMMTSGSTLPSAAMSGPIVTGSTVGSYSPAYAPSGPRRGTVNPGGGEPGPDEGDNSEPYEDPLGDALLPLALLACVYLIMRVARKRKSAMSK